MDAETRLLIEQLVARINQRVAELPDRTSPEDWPEAMLVTGDELEQILHDELEALLQAGMAMIAAAASAGRAESARSVTPQEPLRALIDAWECFDSEAADQNPAPDFTLRNRYRAEIRKLVAALKVATPPKAVTPQEPNRLVVELSMGRSRLAWDVDAGLCPQLFDELSRLIGDRLTAPADGQRLEGEALAALADEQALAGRNAELAAEVERLRTELEVTAVALEDCRWLGWLE